jgi:hypothetical protein
MAIFWDVILFNPAEGHWRFEQAYYLYLQDPDTTQK